MTAAQAAQGLFCWTSFLDTITLLLCLSILFPEFLPHGSHLFAEVVYFLVASAKYLTKRNLKEKQMAYFGSRFKGRPSKQGSRSVRVALTGRRNKGTLFALNS